MKKLILGLLVLVSFTKCFASGYPLWVQAVKEEDGVWAIVAHNAGSSPVFVGVTLKNRVNVRIGGLYSNGQKVLEPGAKETLMIAVADKPEEQMSFEYEKKFVFGRGNGKGDHIGLYRPPFPADLTFDTLNAAADESRKPRTIHSIDILMPEGTPVIAARTGFVMDVAGQPGGDQVNGEVQQFDDPEKMGSYVRIIHDDGTWAEYQNLKTGSVSIRVGERVQAGTQIALSGMTGSAKRPQLRFVVLKAAGGFNEPISQQIKMDMAGQGIKAVKVGDTIGASDSVVPEVKIVVNDPLVIASVKKNEGETKTGVYGTSNQKAAVEENAAFMGLGFVMAIIGVGVIFLIRERKKYATWRELFAQFKRKKPETISEEQIDKEGEKKEFGGEIELRPKKGFFMADWESAFLEAISMGLPVGYTVQMKVSLNRLAARPIWAREDANGFAILRGESVDALVIRQRDWKIIAAIDAVRNCELVDGQAFAKEMKKQILESAGITYIELDAEIGQSKVREILKNLAPKDIGTFNEVELKAA